MEPTPAVFWPEAVIFTGIPGAGKSTFYKLRFAETHVRINLDMLRTRFREGLLLDACIRGRQHFVVDNTNPTAEERARYIRPAKEAGFRVVGYYFRSNVAEALARNAGRPPEQQVPEKGVYGTAGRLQIPSPTEGYDRLYYVRIGGQGGFEVVDWQEAAPP